MMFPGYSDYGVTAWMMVASLVAWLGLITLAAVLLVRAFPQIGRDETA